MVYKEREYGVNPPKTRPGPSDPVFGIYLVLALGHTHLYSGSQITPGRDLGEGGDHIG